MRSGIFTRKMQYSRIHHPNFNLLISHGVYGTSPWRPVTLTSAADADDGDDVIVACLAMESGRGRECLTIAPYRPYSAMMLQLARPQLFSVLRHLARRFWNQTFTTNQHRRLVLAA